MTTCGLQRCGPGLRGVPQVTARARQSQCQGQEGSPEQIRGRALGLEGPSKGSADLGPAPVGRRGWRGLRCHSAQTIWGCDSAF